MREDRVREGEKRGKKNVPSESLNLLKAEALGIWSVWRSMKALSSIRRVTITRAMTCRKRLKDENIDHRYLQPEKRGRDNPYVSGKKTGELSS